jgi:hypothetical protein
LSVAADAAAVLRPKTQAANSAAQVNLAISFERKAVFLSSWEFPIRLEVARPPHASAAKHPDADLTNCVQLVTVLCRSCERQKG